MKVKNIMFSGAMAAILGVTGANAAVTVASQGYVDSKIGEVSTSVENITNNYLTKEDAADTYLTETQVSQQITNVIAAEDGAVATAQAAADKAQGEVDALEEVVATKANAADVYTKDEANAKFEEQAAATQKLTDAKAYTDTQIKELTDNLGGVGDDGEATGLTGTVAAQGVRIGALEDKVGTETVANQIATALTTAQGYADAAEADAVATAKQYSDSLAENYDAAGSAAAVEAKLADYTKTSELDSTFATDAELKAVDDKFANYTTTEALTTTLNSYATTTALKAEEDARKAADEAATAALGNVYTKEQANAEFDKAGSAADVEAKLKLLATADVPAECESESNTCVLSYNGTTFSWAPLTATPTVTE